MTNYLSDYVRTQYGDFKGNVSVDFHGHDGDIYTLCKDYNVDLTEKFPVGFRISEHTIEGVGKQGNVSVTIYLLDENIYGNSFDEIASIIRQKNGIVTFISQQFFIPYSEIGKYIKRFDCLLISHLRDHIQEIKIDEEED